MAQRVLACRAGARRGARRAALNRRRLCGEIDTGEIATVPTLRDIGMANSATSAGQPGASVSSIPSRPSQERGEDQDEAGDRDQSQDQDQDQDQPSRAGSRRDGRYT